MKSRCSLRVCMLVATALAGMALPGSSALGPFDLDVAVPLGTPLEWGRTLPQSYVRPGPLIPARTAHEKPSGPGARYAETQPVSTPRLPNTFGKTRLLTWDVPAHLSWTREPTVRATPSTGSLPQYPPEAHRSFYWTTLASLLRLMLHPQATPKNELLAHVLEIGTPALPALRAARSEGSINKSARWLRERIGRLPTERPEVEPGPSPYDTMMLRFTAEELVACFPHDPNLRFGRRLFLFGESLLSYLGVHTRSEHSLLRRNAVSAVSHMMSHPSSIDILLNVLRDSNDAVARMRAIGGLARYGKLYATAPLIEQLQKTESDPEAVALIHALGRMGDEDAVPTMIKETSHRGRDATLATLIALARIQTDVHRGRAVTWIKNQANSARTNSGRWVNQLAPAHQPDVPDPPGTRVKMVRAAAWLALAKQDPDDRKAREKLLELGRGEPPAPSRFRGYENRALGAVPRAVGHVYVEVVAGLGKDGVERVRNIAGDGSATPSLRTHALAYLPETERITMALELLRVRRSQDASVRAYAFEVLDQVGHPLVPKLAAKLSDQPDERRLARLRPEERYCHLVSLRALGTRGLLSAEDLRPWIEMLGEHAFSPGEFRSRLVAHVEGLIEETVDRRPMPRIRDSVQSLMDAVFARGGNRERREEASAYVEGQLQAVRQNPKSKPVRGMTKTAIVNYVLAISNQRGAGYDSHLGDIEPYVALAETVFLECGRAGGDEAVEMLTRWLKDEARGLRGEVCLALAATGKRKAAIQLAYALEDGDPYVRLCAYEGLKRMTRRDFFADWLYGGPKEVRTGAESYKLFLARKRR